MEGKRWRDGGVEMEGRVEENGSGRGAEVFEDGIASNWPHLLLFHFFSRLS